MSIVAFHSHAFFCSSLDRISLLKDPYIQLFFAESSGGCWNKSPIINRGTFIRTISIDHLFAAFIEERNGAQVVSFGAGFDTRPLRLSCTKKVEIVIELDFDRVIWKKQTVLKEFLQKLSFLQMIPIDLNDFDQVQQE